MECDIVQSIWQHIAVGFHGHGLATYAEYNGSERSWIKRRFFDIKDPDTFAYTTTYRQNEFLSDADIALFEKMKEQNPRRYEIEGEGRQFALYKLA